MNASGMEARRAETASGELHESDWIAIDSCLVLGLWLVVGNRNASRKRFQSHADRNRLADTTAGPFWSEHARRSRRSEAAVRCRARRSHPPMASQSAA